MITSFVRRSLLAGKRRLGPRMQALSPRVVLAKPLNRPKPVILSWSWGNYVGRYEACGSKAVPQKWYTPPSQFDQTAARLYRVGWRSEPVHN